MGTVVLSYIVTPVIIIILSAVIPTILFFTVRNKSKKQAVIISAAALAICICVNVGLSFAVANNPVLICAERFSEHITEERKAEIVDCTRNLYSDSGLLFPGYVEITYADESNVTAHVQYLFYGTVVFTIDFDDNVKSIEKPLY